MRGKTFDYFGAFCIFGKKRAPQGYILLAREGDKQLCTLRGKLLYHRIFLRGKGIIAVDKHI